MGDVGTKRAHHRPVPSGAIKVDLPSTAQVTDHSCGAAALLAICAHFGVGPEDERDVAADMRLTRAGADPHHIVRAATKYGLRTAVHREMTEAQLVAHLDRGCPVMLTLQAWAAPRPRTYAGRWDAGHWVVAIGYDREVFYFEDPVLHVSRGFIDRAALTARWHDVEGPRNTRLERVGVAVWRARPRRRGVATTARRID